MKLTAPALASLPDTVPPFHDPEPLVFIAREDGRHAFRRIGPQCFTGGKLGGEPVECAELLTPGWTPFPAVVPPFAVPPARYLPPYLITSRPPDVGETPPDGVDPPSPIPLPESGLLLMLALGALALKRKLR